MSVLDTARRCLSSAGYTTALVGEEIRFEGTSVLGFIREFASVRTLLRGWKGAQDEFLRTNASALRRDRRKSWNVYSVFLTSERASDEEAQLLISIEEDFRATRKLVRAGMSTDADVEDALGVLLPIRHRVSFVAEDALIRVANRLGSLPTGSVGLMLGGGTGAELAEALLHGEEES